MRAVVLTVEQWKTIREELHTEHPRTVFMLRDKMKRVLGFTVREHKEWISKPDGGYSDYQIHLDFYSENKRTMFLLKFSEVIGNTNGKL
jgi:hypothetical protein